MTLLRAFDGDTAARRPSAYSSTFLVGAALCLLAAAVAWLVPGRELDGVATERDPATEALEVAEGELAAAGLQRLER